MIEILERYGDPVAAIEQKKFELDRAIPRTRDTTYGVDRDFAGSPSVLAVVYNPSSSLLSIF